MALGKMDLVHTVYGPGTLLFRDWELHKPQASSGRHKAQQGFHADLSIVADLIFRTRGS